MEPTRVALVTGAVGGLGTPIAAGLAQAGFRLALSDRAALVPAAAMAARSPGSAAADAVTGRRRSATVGSPIGWPQLAGTDRNVPMAGAPARPARS